MTVATNCWAYHNDEFGGKFLEEPFAARGRGRIELSRLVHSRLKRERRFMIGILGEKK